MRTAKLILSVICLVFLSFTVALAETKSSKLKEKYKKGELLVKYKATAKKGTNKNLSKNYDISNIKSFKKADIHHVKLPKSLDVKSAIELLSQDQDIEYAEPNYIFKTRVFPNDPDFGLQWGLYESNKFYNISAPHAWDIVSNAAEVVVAVIDSGIDYEHPDLSANIWSNDEEIPYNNLDDDGNGKIDDIRGWDFVDNENDPNDQNGHGTHVAGIIGAVGNNAIGVTGVAWRVRLMPVRALDSLGEGYTSDLINAIEYAVSNGAKIINNSWGGYEFSQALKDTIQNSNALFICAAGNENVDTDVTPHYPSSFDCPNIISVASHSNSRWLSGFSNIGLVSVDLSAPGQEIYSTLPSSNSNIYSGSEYGYKDGTSMSSAFVSGVSSLILSANSMLSPTELKTFIENTVSDKLDYLLHDDLASGGILNAPRALLRARGIHFKLMPQHQVNTIGSGQQNYSDSVVLNNGHIFTAWSSDLKDGNGCEIHGKILNSSGLTIKDEFKINTTNHSYLESTQVITLNSNNILVAWDSDSSSGGVPVQGQFLSQTGEKTGDEFTIVESAKNISLLANPEGGFIAVYEYGTSSNREIYGQLFDDSGIKIGAAFSVNDPEWRHQIQPSSTKLSNGTFLVHWSSTRFNGENNYGIYGQFYDSNFNRMGSNFKINSNYDGSASNASFVAALPVDKFVIASITKVDNDELITLQYFYNDGTPAEDEFYANSIPYPYGNLSVNILSKGYFTLSWIGNFGCFIQLFSKDGQQISEGFVVNDGRSNNSGGLRLNLSVISNDSFYVTWTQSYQGSDWSEVYGRTISLIDSDSDNVLDMVEENSCTDKDKFDSDSDGLSDGIEDSNFNGLLDTDETNPCLSDSDGDNLGDGLEDTNGNGVVDSGETDPNDADTDDDGFDDGEEDLNHNGQVDQGESDPTDGNSIPGVNITLKKGFNLIAAPTDVSTQSDLRDWLPEIGNLSQIEKVMIYDSITKKYITLIPENADNPPVILQSGEGLIVIAKQDRVSTFGAIQCTAIDLKQGLNLVGFACPSAELSGFDLLQALGDENVSSIQRINIDTGAFETASFDKTGQVAGVDFSITPGKGYYIQMKQAVDAFAP